MSSPVLPRLLEMHFSELGLLWEQRETRIVDPEWTLAELVDAERRAEAHLDGLRIAGGAALERSRLQLADGEDDGAMSMAAALVLLDAAQKNAGDGSLVEPVLEALAAEEEELREGVRIALRHRANSVALEELRRLAERGDAPTWTRAAAAEILSFWGEPCRFELRPLLEEDDPATRRLVLEALGREVSSAEPSRAWTIDAVELCLEDAEPDLRLAALRSAARRGLRGLPELCRRQAWGRAPGQRCLEAVEMLGVLGDSERDRKPLEEAIDSEESAPAAIRALGALGVAASVPRLLDAMQEAALAEPAAEAVERITGLDLERLPLDLENEALENEDPAVDPVQAKTVWESVRSRYREDETWQSGLAVSGEQALAHLDLLRLRARRDVHLRQRALRASEWPDRELERTSVW